MPFTRGFLIVPGLASARITPEAASAFVSLKQLVTRGTEPVISDFKIVRRSTFFTIESISRQTGDYSFSGSKARLRVQRSDELCSSQRSKHNAPDINLVQDAHNAKHIGHEFTFGVLISSQGVSDNSI